MRGRHNIVVQNARLQYKLSVERNITILRGESATGKTTLINMIADYQRAGDKSGVTVSSDKPLAVLTSLSWQVVFSALRDTIVFIDEGEEFVRSEAFAQAVKQSDNYYVIATRASLFNLPYSIREIFGIKNTTRKRYEGTARLYAEFSLLSGDVPKTLGKPDLVITEDKNAGFDFFEAYFARYGIRCIPAGGKSNIFDRLKTETYTTALVIADGAAFGPELERLQLLNKAKSAVMLYLPESFEWLLLKADVLNDGMVRQILTAPAEHIESAEYFSWERFFTALLTERGQGSCLQYNKKSLNPNYLHDEVVAAVDRIMPKIDTNLKEN